MGKVANKTRGPDRDLANCKHPAIAENRWIAGIAMEKSG